MMVAFEWWRLYNDDGAEMTLERWRGQSGGRMMPWEEINRMMARDENTGGRRGGDQKKRRVTLSLPLSWLLMTDDGLTTEMEGGLDGQHPTDENSTGRKLDRK